MDNINVLSVSLLVAIWRSYNKYDVKTRNWEGEVQTFDVNAGTLLLRGQTLHCISRGGGPTDQPWAYLAVVQSVSVVAVARVLLVAVEAVVVRSVEGMRNWKYFRNKVNYLSSRSAALAGRPEERRDFSLSTKTKYFLFTFYGVGVILVLIVFLIIITMYRQ